jgi:hypothetical protein
MPVFRFVKDLLGKKEGPASAAPVRLEALPGLIDEEEAAVGARLGPAFEGPAREVRKGVANLQGRLERLARADWDSALHPKLEQISRTTLPAFVRAMESCLARPLPDDPHEFYGAAAALLKCSISALRGQGRYLRAVLPNEMSAIKTDIDLIGHAVNAMTAALGEEKRELAALEALRHRFDRVTALDAEERDAVRLAEEAAAELAALAGERAGAEAELAALNGSATARDLDERRAEADRLRLRAGGLQAAQRRENESLIKVLRRAERLVARRGDKQTATRLHHLQSTLADPLTGDASALAPLVAGGLGVVRDLVAAGEIEPKEGDPAFDDPAAVVAAVGARAEEYGRAAEEIAALDRELAASPVVQDRERLAACLRQTEHRAAVLEDERAGLERVAGQKATERATVIEGLDGEVTAVFDGRVRLEPHNGHDDTGADCYKDVSGYHFPNQRDGNRYSRVDGYDSGHLRSPVESDRNETRCARLPSLSEGGWPAHAQ